MARQERSTTEGGPTLAINSAWRRVALDHANGRLVTSSLEYVRFYIIARKLLVLLQAFRSISALKWG